MLRDASYRRLTVSALLFLLGGLALYVSGVLLWADSAGVRGQTLAGCKCVALTAEGLVGATMSVVGFLMLPLAVVLGTLAVRKWWHTTHPPFVAPSETTAD